MVMQKEVRQRRGGSGSAGRQEGGERSENNGSRKGRGSSEAGGRKSKVQVVGGRRMHGM